MHYEGDFVTVATCTTPTEAHLLKETLVAAGMPAQVADANFIQANSWMSNAAGGVRVLVPSSRLAEAREAVASFNAGAFQLEAEAGADDGPADTRGLKPFQIFRHAERKPGVVAVKQGFSWSAFLIGPLWFLLNGMWMTFVLSLSFTWGSPLLIRSLAETNGPHVQVAVVVVFFTIWVLTGWVANFLLGEELKRKGYAIGPLVRARSTGEAINAAQGSA